MARERHARSAYVLLLMKSRNITRWYGTTRTRYQRHRLKSLWKAIPFAFTISDFATLIF
jgi:hypothetical protein